MNLLSKRLKKNGYSWSLPGLDAMVSALIHHLEGTLADAVHPSTKAHKPESDTTEKKPSMSHYLREKTQEAIGVLSGRLPVLAGRDQSKPFAQALRGLARLSEL